MQAKLIELLQDYGLDEIARQIGTHIGRTSRTPNATALEFAKAVKRGNFAELSRQAKELIKQADAERKAKLNAQANSI